MKSIDQRHLTQENVIGISKNLHLISQQIKTLTSKI